MDLLTYILLTLILLPLWITLYYFIPYLTTFSPLHSFPGPPFAKFSNLWLAYHSRRRKRYSAIHSAHRKYGTLVRVGYNHISIASEEAISLVYAHGTGWLKSEFYDAFVSGVPGVFNTRDRAQHARKRRVVAHAFSPGAVGRFEPYMAEDLETWVGKLDSIAKEAEEEGSEYKSVNMMPWCTYIAFDIIGHLAFGKAFGMVKTGRDECVSQRPDGYMTRIAGAETLNRRGEVSATLGWMPALRPFAEFLPDAFFSRGLQSVKDLHGIAALAVSQRLDAVQQEMAKESDRHDILALLLKAKDPDGEAVPYEEVVSEALTQLIAGSDTISNTACAIIYLILAGERDAPGTILPRLQRELDAAIPGNEKVAMHKQIKNAEFLKRCIHEGMRLHSTSALRLPRIVTSAEGVCFEGHHFPMGTVLSVPSFTLHHDLDIWGDDVEVFNPDRWLPERLTQRQKMAFITFSHGPRACVGQNVAMMELQLIVATLFRRYDLELQQEELKCSEGFTKKPVEYWVGIKRRV
ncbi:cytochrome p450 benzoate 4-monooxygenase [Aureobasidium namibiae CBS 147.97]|uniref:Cytochrome p450 benzoate 4-monooxygenase n=1 Tax=Aureobasidium namibiae CBS 147.97 TaxID=1043004 RepID=A0A074WW26_9PEZI